MALFEAVRILIMFALAFVVALFVTPFVVHVIHRFGLKKNNIRDEKDTPVFHKFHEKKSGTATMAGAIVWLTVLGLAVVFFVLQRFFDGFSDYFNFVSRAETYLPLAALFFAAMVGLVDDIWGIRGIGKGRGGLSIPQRLVLYGVVALVGALWFYFRLDWDVLYVPFVGHISIGPWYILFFIFILMASSFSTNEADGLDGLAGGVLFLRLWLWQLCLLLWDGMTWR